MVDSMMVASAGEAAVSGVSLIDTHASYGLGRYALGLLWYAKLTGNGVIDNTFSDFDEDISEKN